MRPADATKPIDDPGVFPCDAVPEDANAARLLGLYPQRQEGMWMQRLKVLGGVLSAGQWHTLAGVVRRFTPDTPLHLTTRQDVELHNLSTGKVPCVQRRLFDAGLSGLGGCGDTLRNITVCPCSGTLAGTVDLLPLAWEIRRLLESTDGIHALPRKFKISLSACEDACSEPWINDLGFIALRSRDGWGFRVVGAGSLGRKPGTATRLYERIAPWEVLPCVLAAVRVFAAEGDRENRSRARLRHVRERLGDKAFAELIDRTFAETRAERTWSKVALAEPSNPFTERVTLSFANGDVDADAAEALAALVGRKDTAVRIANGHRVLVFTRDAGAAERIASEFPSLAPAAAPGPSVLACPGTRWCHRALADTHTLSDRLRRELADVLTPEVDVRISGCPNGCAHSAVADIGLVGGKTGPAGAKTDAWMLFVGGGRGRDDRLAAPVAGDLSADAVVTHLRKRLGADSR